MLFNNYTASVNHLNTSYQYLLKKWELLKLDRIKVSNLALIIIGGFATIYLGYRLGNYLFKNKTQVSEIKYGLKYNNLTELDKIKANYEEILSQNPHHFEALVGLGQCLLHLNQHLEAKQVFEEALTLNSCHTQVLNHYILTLLYLNELDEAKSWIDQILEKDAQQSEALINYAYLLANDLDKKNNGFTSIEIEQKIEKINQLTRQALKSNPNNIDALIFKIMRRINHSTTEYLENIFEQAFRLAPSHPDILSAYAFFLDYRKISSPEEFYKKSLEINPYHLMTLRYYSKYLFIKNLELENEEIDVKIIEMLEKLLSFDSYDIESRIRYAICLANLDYIQEAEEQFKQILQDDPSNTYAFSMYVEFLKQQERSEEAEEVNAQINPLNIFECVDDFHTVF